MARSALEVVVRPTVPDDVDELTELWGCGWRETHLDRVPGSVLPHRRPADFRRRMSAQVDRSVTAVVEHRLAGFVTVRENELEQLYVDPSFRGGRVASVLLDAGEQRIGVRFPHAWLAVIKGNARARAFYRRHGWRDRGPFQHHAPTADGGMVAIPALRYDKTVTPTRQDDP